jgi:hypothetical protein
MPRTIHLVTRQQNALGMTDNQCCEGYGFHEVEDDSLDEFAETD